MSAEAGGGGGGTSVIDIIWNKQLQDKEGLLWRQGFVAAPMLIHFVFWDFTAVRRTGKMFWFKPEIELQAQ